MTQLPPYPPESTWDYETQNSLGGPPARTSGMAIASLVCGIIAVFTCCTFLPGILAIVLGAVAMPPIRQGQARGRGLAVSGIVLGVIGVVLGIIVWIIVALSPATIPVQGRDVSAADRATLVSIGALEEGEQITLFCATGGFSIEDGGVVLTDERLVVYFGQGDIEECSLADIRAIMFTPAEDWYDDSDFVVETDDDTMIMFWIGADESGDRLFYRTLRRKVDQAREEAGKPLVEAEILDDSEFDDGDD